MDITYILETKHLFIKHTAAYFQKYASTMTMMLIPTQSWLLLISNVFVGLMGVVALTPLCNHSGQIYNTGPPYLRIS